MHEELYKELIGKLESDIDQLHAKIDDQNKIIAALSQLAGNSGQPAISLSDIALTVQMLSWGREEGLTDSQERDIDAHQTKMFALLGNSQPAGHSGPLAGEVVGKEFREWICAQTDNDLRDIFQYKPELAARVRLLLPDNPRQRIEISDWISDPETIPKSIIQVCREAIRLEFGNNGTDGYYKRILAKIFSSLLSTPLPSPPEPTP